MDEMLGLLLHNCWGWSILAGHPINLLHGGNDQVVPGVVHFLFWHSQIWDLSSEVSLADSLTRGLSHSYGGCKRKEAPVVHRLASVQGFRSLLLFQNKNKTDLTLHNKKNNMRKWAVLKFRVGYSTAHLSPPLPQLCISASVKFKQVSPMTIHPHTVVVKEKISLFSLWSWAF